MVRRGYPAIEWRICRGRRCHPEEGEPRIGDRIAVVGGGIGGLTLLYALEREGVGARLFEAQPEVGGVIRSWRRDGRLIEEGPHRIRLTPPVRRLVAELGLDGELVVAPAELPLLILRGGRLRRAPLTLRELASTSLLSPWGKARLLMEPLVPGRRGAGRAPGTTPGAMSGPDVPPRAGHGRRSDSDETVEEYLVRRCGREAYQVLLGPLFGGLYGSDPSRMRVRHALAPLLDSLGVQRSLVARYFTSRTGGTRRTTPPVASFRDGIQTLPRALAERLRDRIETGVEVIALERRGSGWFVRTSRGEAGPFHQVVLTLPADRTGELLRGAAPDTADRLARLHYNRIVLVHLESELQLGASGYQVAFGEALATGQAVATRGVTSGHDLFGRERAYTAFLGGAWDPEAADLPDEDLARIAVEEFEEATGAAARPLLATRTRIPSWDLSWDALDGLSLPEGVRLLANYVGRAGVPSRIEEGLALGGRLVEKA